MKNKTLIQAFMLNFGSVESTRLAWLPALPRQPFYDPKEAFIDLAKFLKSKYDGEASDDACCVASKKGKKKVKFCSTCGNSLAEREFNEDSFKDFLNEIYCGDIDSYNALIESDHNEPWNLDEVDMAGLMTLKPDEVIFVYTADECLLAAIGHSKRKEKTIDYIFEKADGSIFYW